MSRTRQVLWASALSGAGVFVSMAAALVILKLATHSLNKPDFGVFVLVQFWADALNIFANFGLAVSLPRLVAAAGPEEQERTVGVALTGTAVTSGAVAVIGWIAWWVAMGTLGARLGEDDQRFLAFAWLVPPLFFVGVMRDTAMGALAGLHRFSHRAASMVIASGLSMLIAGFCVWSGRVSVASFSGALALGHGLNLVWLYIALPRGARWHWDAAGYRRTAHASLALYQNNMLTFVYQRVDALLAQWLLGLEAVSMLGAVKYFPTILSRVVSALHVPLLPNLASLIAQGDFVTAGRVMNRAIVLTSVLGYTAVLGSAALAGPLLLLFTSSKFVSAAPVLGWLMTAMCLALQAGIMGLALIALGRASAVTKSNVGLAIISAGLNFALLPHFGFVGAGYAATGSILFSVAAQGVFVHRYGLPLALRPWLTIQVLFIACAGASWCLGVGPIAGLFGALMFPALCVASGALARREIQVLFTAVFRHR